MLGLVTRSTCETNAIMCVHGVPLSTVAAQLLLQLPSIFRVPALVHARRRQKHCPLLIGQCDVSVDIAQQGHHHKQEPVASEACLRLSALLCSICTAAHLGIIDRFPVCMNSTCFCAYLYSSVRRVHGAVQGMVPLPQYDSASC
jgi:hypothetical protein